MAQAKPTTYNLSLSKLMIGGLIIFIAGAGVHFGLQKIGALKSSASTPCQQASIALENFQLSLQEDGYEDYDALVASGNQAYMDTLFWLAGNWYDVCRQQSMDKFLAD